MQPVNLETNPAAVFGVVVQCLARFFDGLSVKIGGMAQELHMLVELAESSSESSEATKVACSTAKLLLDRVNKSDVQLLKVIHTYELQSQHLELVYSRLLRTVKVGLTEATELFFSFQRTLESETEGLILKATNMLNQIEGFQGFLIWEDMSVQTTVRRFLDGLTSSQRQKGAVRAEIHFPASVQTIECQKLNGPLLRCQKTAWSSTCANISHADHVFSNSSRCLSNLRNLDQSLLYLKLHFSSLSSLLTSYLSHLRTKLQVYSSAKESSELLKAQLPTNTEINEVFDQMVRLAGEIESEGRKIATHIDLLPEQLAISAKVCLGIDGEQKVQGLLRESRLKSLVNACGKVRVDVGEVVGGEIEVVERIKMIARGKSAEKEGENDLSSTNVLPTANFPLDISELAHIFAENLKIRPLYRYFHLKSEILKQYQPHSLSKEMYICRGMLEDRLLQCFGGKDEEMTGKVTALTVRTVDVRKGEGGVRTSRQVPSLHSYSSSWDLETNPQPSDPASFLDTKTVSTVKDPNQWSESSLSCSVASLKDLVDGPDSGRKFEVKGLKGVYYPIERIPDKLNLVRNTLNRQTKDLYSSGVTGWKQSLKSLGASEKQLQRAISGTTDLPWHDDISPVPEKDSVSHVSPHSNTFVRSHLSRSNTPNRIKSISEHSSQGGPRYSRSTFRPSFQAGTGEVELIGQRSEKTAIMKLSRSSNLVQMIRSTAKGQRLEEEIVRELNRLAPKVDTNVGRQLSATVHHATHYLKHRIDLVQRDRSLSPFDKIKCVRSEFHRYYSTMKRPKSTVRARP